jgi:hypothetical protein
LEEVEKVDLKVIKSLCDQIRNARRNVVIIEAWREGRMKDADGRKTWLK